MKALTSKVIIAKLDEWLQEKIDCDEIADRAMEIEVKTPQYPEDDDLTLLIGQVILRPIECDADGFELTRREVGDLKHQVTVHHPR